MKVFDKYNQALIGEVEMDSWDQVYEKINYCKAAYDQFKRSSIALRESWIHILVSALEEHSDYLALLISKEAGKPLFYAQNELERCIRTAKLGTQYFHLLNPKIVDIDFSGTHHRTAQTQRFPLGVVFGIAPFNFPLNLALHKIIPAIACGNTILIKPSPYTPLSLDFLIKTINKKLPKGLIEITHCDNEVAEKIVSNEKISFVSFTGSAEVGWYIKSLLPTKKVALELGGNAALYIDETTNISQIISKIVQGCYLYAGQICISTQRIFVHQSQYDSFVDQFIEEIKSIKSGNPLDEVANVPLIDKAHLKRINSWIQEAKSMGAEILAGGTVQDETKNIFQPTLIGNVSKGMKVYNEEVFGPVATVTSVSNHKEAIEKINDSKYGLQAGIFSTNELVITSFYNELEVGGVIINDIPGFRRDEMPYGGIKSSGFGREGIAYAMEEMTELKLIIT